MTFPVALFVYNRPQHARRTLDALARNRFAAETDLLIFSDGPRSSAEAPAVERVRSLCRDARGFRSLRLIEREHNLGLAPSILRGVDEVLAEHRALIVLEDDLLTSPHFLSYMNAALAAYAGDPRLLSVSAYVPPSWLMSPARGRADVWLSLRPMSFGWGTWRERWRDIDWTLPDYADFCRDPAAIAAFARSGADLPQALAAQQRGDIDSWAIRFAYAHFRQGRFALLPRHSHIRPIGFDGSGRHCLPNPTRWFESYRRAPAQSVFPQHLQPDPKMQARLRGFFDRHHALSRLLGLTT
jgi:hypothetical protein